MHGLQALFLISRGLNSLVLSSQEYNENSGKVNDVIDEGHGFVSLVARE